MTMQRVPDDETRPSDQAADSLQADPEFEVVGDPLPDDADLITPPTA
jgi:hypothetical protein